MQANLADIGIKVSIDVQDTATFYAPSAAALKKLQLFGLDFASFPDPFWSMQWFTTAQIGPGGYNWMSWSNQQFDHLNDQAAAELDDAKRTELYIQDAEDLGRGRKLGVARLALHHLGRGQVGHDDRPSRRASRSSGVRRARSRDGPDPQPSAPPPIQSLGSRESGCSRSSRAAPSR